MENGSLEEWLHQESEGQIQCNSLNILQRLNIAIDVASALYYLHHQCEIPVVHSDLKPSNILLDDDMIAHVSDFGLARLIPSFSGEGNLNLFSSLEIQGTIGYTPPGKYPFSIFNCPLLKSDKYFKTWVSFKCTFYRVSG